MGRLTSKSYHLAKLGSYLHFLWSTRKEPLLVYQMGKVGSSTIIRSLQAREPIRSIYSIYHVHFLTSDRLHYEEMLYKQARIRNRGDLIPKQRLYPGYVWVGQQLTKRIAASQPKTQWRIITLVRDPIARNISSFFQNLHTLLSYDYRTNLQSSTINAVVHDLVNLFLDNYLEEQDIERIDANPLTWFDLELKKIFGVDVFTTRFPSDKGYEIYETSRAKVLLLRLEDLDKCAVGAFREFIGIENLTLIRSNISNSKAYSNIYEAFLRKLILPSQYVDKIYSSKYSMHFYSEREIKSFRSKWEK